MKQPSPAKPLACLSVWQARPVRKAQSQEKGLFRFAILSKETGNAVGTLECSSATEGNDSAKTMRIGLAGQHDSESYLEEALRFAVLTLIPPMRSVGCASSSPMPMSAYLC